MNEFKKVGLDASDRIMIDLLEEILEELKEIRKNTEMPGRTTPSPS